MKKKVVTIGGGTGTFTTLTGLKAYTDRIDITSIVSVADDGGSTGRLIDHFGVLPVGDVRQALVALSDNAEEQELLRDLFLYRFDKGESGLKGHNLGNLLLIALSEITGSEAAAIEAASKILDVRGIVLPVSENHSCLVATYEDGSEVRGESAIDKLPETDAYKKITSLTLDPELTLYEKAHDAIVAADYIVFGPGDLYTSIVPNILVHGFTDAVAESSAKLIYVANLMSKHGQTNAMSVQDHVAELESYLNSSIDIVVINNEPIPEKLLEVYAGKHEIPVVDDYQGEAVRTPMLSEAPPQSQADVVRRSLVRHDSQKLAEAIISLI